MAADLILPLGADLQVIVENDRLPIQHEILEIRIRLQQGQQVIHQVHQLQAELLESLIPFAVPMGVRNQV
jgi:hypothetical protein